MFVNIGRVTPKAGRESDLATNMCEFRDELLSRRGCRAAHVLRDLSSGELLGVSMWVDREAFAQAMREPRTRVPKYPPGELRDVPPTVAEYEEID